MLYSQMASDMNVTTNLWEGLLSFDCYGKAVPSVAKEWSHNEDSSVWTFNLRDDVDWVDVNGEVKAHLTSKDFLVGLEWVLNAAKNQANNTSMPNETLTGAADYYQKTSDMGDAAADRMITPWSSPARIPAPTSIPLLPTPASTLSLRI